jgi:hypothetical protein
LEQRAAEATEHGPPPEPESQLPVPLWLFYVVLFTFGFFKDELGIPPTVPRRVVQLAALGLGLTNSVMSRRFNLWTAFCAGFTLPVVMILGQLPDTQLGDLSGQLGAIAELSFQCAYLAAAGSLPAMLVPGRFRMDRLSPVGLLEWVRTSQPHLGRAEQWLVAVNALLAAMATLLSPLLRASGEP